MKKTKIVLPIIILIVNLLWNCSEFQIPVAPQQFHDNSYIKNQSDQIQRKASLNILAKQFAISLNDRSFAKSLRDNFLESKDKEQIIDLSNFLSAVINGETVLQFWGKLKNTNQEFLSEKELLNMSSIFPNGVDIYFPVDDHRDIWFDKLDKVIVSFQPVGRNDVEYTELTAYSLNGESETISVVTPPNTPCLIIGPSERFGINIVDEVDEGGGGGVVPGDPYFKIVKLKMNHTAKEYEPWWKGDAEFVWRYLNPDEYQVGDDDGEISHECWKLTWSGYITNMDWQTHNHQTDFNLTDYWYNYFYFKMYEHDSLDSDDYMGTVLVYSITTNTETSENGWYSMSYTYYTK